MSKTYNVSLDNKNYWLMDIDGLIIGFPHDMTYEVASTKVLKYPIKTLETAAKRLLKRRDFQAKAGASTQASQDVINGGSL